MEQWNTWALGSKCRYRQGKDTRSLVWDPQELSWCQKSQEWDGLLSLMLGLWWGPRYGDRGCKNGSLSKTNAAILVKTIFTKRKSFSAQSTAMWHCSAVSTILAETGVCLSICPTHMLCVLLRSWLHGLLCAGLLCSDSDCLVHSTAYRHPEACYWSHPP